MSPYVRIVVDQVACDIVHIPAVDMDTLRAVEEWHDAK